MRIASGARALRDSLVSEVTGQRAAAGRPERPLANPRYDTVPILAAVGLIASFAGAFGWSHSSLVLTVLCYAVACGSAFLIAARLWERDDRTSLVLIVVAAALRVPAFVQPPGLSNDAYRYGSRTRGIREPRSLSPLQIGAGRAAGMLVGKFFGTHFSDMGPQRVIARTALERLAMTEQTYGWNLQMQILAARAKLRIAEIPVPHRRRTGGVSKVSGDIKAAPVAAFRIAAVFLRSLTTCR